MSVDVEDLIRQAQERQADRAVHGERIRAALPARAARVARQHRYGRLVAVAAAGAVAAAVTVPVLVLRDRAPDLSPGAAASPSMIVDKPPVVVTTFRVRYRPTWLPPGLAERSRVVGYDEVTGKPVTGPQRRWTPGPVGTDGEEGQGVSVTTRPAQGPADPGGSGGEAVDVNGRRGYYHGGQTKAYVEWRAEDDTVVVVGVRELRLSRSELLRVARSVRPDQGKMTLPLRPGWLPAGMKVHTAQVSGDSPTAWFAQLSAEGAGPAGADKASGTPSGLMVSLGPTTGAPAGGRTLTVAGRPARLVDRTGAPYGITVRYLVVDRGAGSLLTVTASWSAVSPLTDEDLIRVARNTEVDGAGQRWIGSR